MATIPATGERPVGFRRSSSQFASLPQRSLSLHEKVGLAKDDAAADVLYTHPSVRIYSFQPPTDALNSLDKTKKTLPDADYPIDAIEILPWRAKTESLAAGGKLIIEKVQGSVHFLKSGELIHTIMKNSQCWCVDGESKFVMRIGKLRYLRIEMPTAEPEGKQKVEEFKGVISRILRFEKTPCPFIRAFQVDLPEDAITPRRRGTWKRKESLTSIPAEDDPRPIRKTKTARTMSMRGMPPSAFPSRSLTQLDLDRPRTASTLISTDRFSFQDIRTDSPTNYTSGEDNTDSDRHDSESDRPDTGHNSEVDDSDREVNAPIVKSPLNNVQTLSPVVDRPSAFSLRIHEPEQTVKSKEVLSSIMTPDKSPKISEPASTELPVSDSEAVQRAGEGATISSSATLTDPVLPSIGHSIAQPNLDNTQSHPLEESSASSSESLEPRRSAEPSLSDIAVRKGENITQVESAPTLAPGEERIESLGSLKDTSDDKLVDLTMARGVTIDLTDDPLEQPSFEPENSKDVAYNIHTMTESAAAANKIDASKRDEDAESTASLDSFHTLLSDDDVVMLHQTTSNTRPFQHRREISEMTVTADTWNESHGTPLEPVSSATEPMPDLEQSDHADTDQMWSLRRTPGAFTDESELRRRLQHRRSLSPLPPAAILHTSYQSGRNSPIPAVLLQKAATLAVVKPIEVVVFLVQVLARIAGGATMNDLVSGELFRNPGVRRTASGTFDQNVRRPVIEESEEEDDYGVPVHGRRKSSVRDGKPDLPHQQDIDDAASFASID